MSGRKPRFKCKSEAQKKAIKISYAKRSKQNKNGKSKKNNGNKRKNLPVGELIPLGRTLSTYDNYLPFNNKKPSFKERPVVVIEVNNKKHLAVVPLSSRKGNNRTELPNYQQGQSYFKHFVETFDNEGQPIVLGEKFRSNHPNEDVSSKDVEIIKDRVLFHSVPAPENFKKIEEFRARDNEDENKDS